MTFGMNTCPWNKIFGGVAGTIAKRMVRCHVSIAKQGKHDSMSDETDSMLALLILCKHGTRRDKAKHQQSRRFEK